MAYKQHFIEWFSGKQLPSYWTTGTISGSPAFAMVDAVDGGFGITCNAGGEQGYIAFNNKRQFSPTASEIIFVMKRTGTSCVGYGGFYNAPVGATELADWRNDTRETYTQLFTADAGTRTGISTTTAIHTNWATGKIVCGSSNIKLYEDGVLGISKTTNRPTTKMQPTLTNVSLTTSDHLVSFRYCEAYNT